MATPATNEASSLTKAFWRNLAVRAAIYWAFLNARVIFSFIRRVGTLANPKPSQTNLLIGATKAGWELIELEEVWASASEYLGQASVSQVVFGNRNTLVSELAQALKESHPSHFYYDPRAGADSFWRGIVQAFSAGALFSWYQTTPICMLTDFPIWGWQMQVAIVSAESGVVATIDSASKTRRFFPHSRIVGPLPMSISIATADSLDRKRRSATPDRSRGAYVAFIGSMYPDRADILNNIFQKLHERGIKTKAITRALGGSRISNEEYWNELQAADIIVTTSAILSAPGTLELLPPNHLVFRFLETTASSTCLVAQFTAVASSYFESGSDYVAFTTVEEAVVAITELIDNPAQREEVARNGHAVARSLIDAHYFWRALNLALGAKSLR